MKNIDIDFGKALFERVFEATKHTESLKTRFLSYRQILEELFKELTRDENRFFSNLFARTKFIFNTYNTPEYIQRGVDFTRRTTNKIVHPTDYTLKDTDELYCIKNLCLALKHFSDVPVPSKLKETYEPGLAKNTENKAEQVSFPKQESYHFYAIVTQVLPANENPKTRKILCENEDFGVFSLLLWDNRDENGFGSDLTPFAALIQDLPYAKIYVTDAKAYPNRDNEFYTTVPSLVVLEPDYFIEAKSLAECIQVNGGNPAIHLLSRFDKGSLSEAMLIGTLVGNLLDDMSREPQYIYQDTFKKFMKEQAFSLLILANQNGTYNRTAIRNIYDAAQAHETNIRSQIRSAIGKTIYIEPTFVSAEYGLLGRLDALYEDKQDSKRKDILELKSGRAPNQGMYPNHEAQAQAYNLMLKSVYPDRVGTSSILYSNCREGNPVRHVESSKFLDKLRLLMVRNEIVANEIKLGLGNVVPLYALCHSEAAIPNFSIPVRDAFKRTYQSLPSLERAYFEEYVAFTFRELRIAKLGSEDTQDGNRGFAALWKRSKSQKMADYDALVNLTIRSISENSILELSFPKTDLFNSTVSGLRAGDAVVLYPTPDPEILNPLRSQILKGSLTEVNPDGVKVALINKQVDESYFRSCALWAVERDFSESGYKEWLLALYRFMGTSSEHKALVFGQTAPAVEEQTYPPNPQLNANQNEIASQALNAKNYYLIQGPPGTGKTSQVLREIVLRLTKKGEHILVLAFTNRAVDEICQMLAKNLAEQDFIRLGRNKTGANNWQQLAGSLKLNELNERLSSARVVVSTQASFASSMDILTVKPFDTLVVDEASQLTEPHLVGFLHRFKRFILIGDEKQLPAVVLQDESKSQTKSDELKAIGLPNLRESLFTRLLLNAQKKGWNHCYGLLEQHYRMHQDIASFINRRFYDSKLVCGQPRQKEPIQQFSPDGTSAIEQKLARNRVIFIPSRKELSSKVNEYEASIVKSIVTVLQERYGTQFDPEKTVGVITPFRAQMATIRKNLGKDFQKLTVDTVERYQGSERDIIVISYALRSHSQLQSISSIGPGGVDRKLNVALSRAKEFLLITGCEEVLRKHNHISALLDEIKQQGGYLDLTPHNTPATDGNTLYENELF